MARFKMNRREQVIIGVLAIVLAIYIAVFVFFDRATSPFQSARTQVINIAKEKAELKTTDSFGMSTTDTSSYSVIGSDQSGKKIGVIVPKDSEKLTVIEMNKGIAPEKLREKNTSSIILTIYKNNPAWEVNSASGFKIYDFATGKKLLG